MKLRNNTKNRNATANEIAKKLIIDKLEIALYFQDNNDYKENYSEEFIQEIYRHINKHIDSIAEKLNPNNNSIDMF
tara:strand:+ start:838 stop:1065 length:228 start_codon:yes stop_codon:yes gene_type:complete